jgi:nitrate/nitrite-specific signal transduction histidine kinase
MTSAPRRRSRISPSGRAAVASKWTSSSTSQDDATVRVTVRDDGRGFDPIAHTDGFGLLGMRERVELLSGTLEVKSSPGEGTTINATFPTRDRGDTQRRPSDAHPVGADAVTQARA